MSNVAETSKEAFARLDPNLGECVLALLKLKGPSTIEALAAALHKPQSTISGVLRPLVKDGLVFHCGFAQSNLSRRVRVWSYVT